MWHGVKSFVLSWIIDDSFALHYNSNFLKYLEILFAGDRIIERENIIVIWNTFWRNLSYFRRSFIERTIMRGIRIYIYIFQIKEILTLSNHETRTYSKARIRSLFSLFIDGLKFQIRILRSSINSFRNTFSFKRSNYRTVQLASRNNEY